MATAASTERKRIHPHKFLMWVGIGSIIMMFAGLTSAYIVRRNQVNWLQFELPKVFWISTVAILCSSLTIYLAGKSFRAREMKQYRMFITITAALGIAFGVLQWMGFQDLWGHGIQLIGQDSNPSASFLLVIVGLHVLHVLGGIIALIIIFIKAYSNRTKSYNNTTIEVISTYWHFVDILWIYLFIFLLIIH